MVIDPADSGATTAAARNLLQDECLTISHLLPVGTPIGVREVQGYYVPTSDSDTASGFPQYTFDATPPSVGMFTISASSPLSGTQWVYTGSDSSGNVVTLYNRMEPCVGTPGPLGVNVGSTGQVNSGNCVVQAIGPGAGVIAVPGTGNAWYFSVSNSAQ